MPDARPPLLLLVLSSLLIMGAATVLLFFMYSVLWLVLSMILLAAGCLGLWFGMKRMA